MPDRVVCLYDFAADELAALFAHRDVEHVLLDGTEDAGCRRDELARATVVIASLHRHRALTAADLAVMRRCRLVQTSAVGFDSVDHVAAAQLGIPVANLPGFNVAAVADWTLLALLWLLRRPDLAAAGVARGEWSPHLGEDLARLTVGIAGFGRIGRAVARRLAGFGAGVLVFDARPVDGGYRQLELDELLRRSDAVSVHLPLNDATRALLDADRLALLRPGAYLVNAGRGGVVDEAALAAALDAGRLGGAALDVFATEPLAADSPHCAGHTRAAAETMRRRLVEAIDHVLDGGAPRNVVNEVLADAH
jgi:D-3-phosphoglycerate dehydrogenase